MSRVSDYKELIQQLTLLRDTASQPLDQFEAGDPKMALLHVRMTAARANDLIKAIEAFYADKAADENEFQSLTETASDPFRNIEPS